MLRGKYINYWDKSEEQTLMIDNLCEKFTIT